MQFTKEQEKWGAMTALLSLDVVKPFYSYMGLAIDDPDQFAKILRAVIIANRQAFETSPEKVPDLKKRVQEKLTAAFDTDKAQQLDIWFNDYFVWFAQDSSDYEWWGAILMQSANISERWLLLGIPERITEVARQKLFNQVMSNADSEINALADRVDELPKSKWDIEMYALHQFDDDDNDPFFIGVMPVVEYRRIKKYVKWLVESLTPAELELFLENANQLRLDNPEMQILAEIRLPEGL